MPIIKENMYPLAKPFIDYTNAQSDAYAQLTKANIENFSRFVQDWSRGFSAMASEAQTQLAKGIDEGTRQLREAPDTIGNIMGSAAHETLDAMKTSAEHVSEETDVAIARAARRR